jgi:methanogenic corrinoid protein MtbC1
MATAFGISGLKSKLGYWRENRKATAPDHDDLPDNQAGQANWMNDAQTADNDFDGVDTDYVLSRLLENLVIPKLIANREQCMHGNDPDHGRIAESELQESSPRLVITDTDVEQFSCLSLDTDAHGLMGFVDKFLAAGHSVETIYIDLLAPAARKLGKYWEEDSQDFMGVTMGLWRIQEILRELSLRLPPTSVPGHGQRSALFTTMPGSQHSLGVLMVAECFQRAGWDADVLIEPTQSELIGKFAKHHYAVIGLSVTCDCTIEVLSGLVTAIRAVSSNPKVRIFLGGRFINENPELVELCGADATALDALSTVDLANTLIPASANAFEY